MNSFPGRGENVKLGKGALFLDLDAKGYEFVGNCTSVAVASDITKQELYSSTEASGALLDSTTSRVKYTITPVISEFTLTNLKLFLKAQENDKPQTADTGDTFAITNAKLGRYYDVGKRQISGVTVSKGSVEVAASGNWEVNEEFGVVHLFANATDVDDDDDLVVNFESPELTIQQLRIATAGQAIAKLLYLADDANNAANPAKDRLECWRVDVAPDGELNLISDDYGSFSLSMTLLTDAANHPDEPYGTLDRINAAA
jgi:hypothetical protein